MNRCDFCDKPAVVHEVTVKNGVKKEVHLCAHHAKQAGIDVAIHQPINQLLTQFVLQQAGQTPQSATPGKATQAQIVKKSCPGCGMTWAQFRQSNLMGCGDCYEAFETQLAPLIERAQNGAVHHVGKTPQHAGGSIDRQALIRQLVKAIDEAVAAEQYERAASLRDRLMGLESAAAAGPADGAAATSQTPARSGRAGPAIEDPSDPSLGAPAADPDGR